MYMGFSILSLAAIFEVVVPTVPRPWETTAADELKSALSKRVSERLTVEGMENVRFHVGDTGFAAEKGLLSAAFEDEEWSVRSFGADVVLNGGGSHGALYAVSHFLEDACDVRFWNDEDTDVPESKEVSLPKLDLRGRPKFRYRDIHRHLVPDPEVFTSRFAILRRLNRNGDIGVPKEYGGEFAFGPPYFCHTFDLYVPWTKYGKSHPEWFALWKGERKGGRTTGQLCLSQPEVRRMLREGVLKSIAAGEAAAKRHGTPPPKLYDLSQNDDSSWCECPACTAAVLKYGQSGFYLTVINEVADEIAKTHPDVFLTTLAYHYTEDLPKGGVRPRDNVIVRLCDTRSNQAAPITDPCNRTWLERVVAWGKVAKNLMIWDYAIVFDNPAVFFPLPSERTIGETYRTFRDNNVFGIFLEHEHPKAVDFFDIKYYLESKFMEDPYQDSDKLVADAFARYFGAGAPMVTEARRLLEDSRRQSSDHIIYHPRTEDYDFITKAVADRMKALFDRAEAAVAHDPARLRHVRKARRSTDEIYRLRQVEFDPATRTLSWTPEAVELTDPQRLRVVDDAKSPSGRTLRIDLPETEFPPPYGFELYDAWPAKVTASGLFKDKPADSYVWNEFGNVRIPETGNSFVYFTREWTARLRLCHPDLNSKTGTLRILARVQEMRRYVARVEFVLDPPRLPFDVILPKEPRPWEKTAARELETFLSRCARKRLAIGGHDRIRFHIGDTFLAWEKDLLSSQLQDEEWVVRSYGRDVLVNGGGTHGALYAVSHFLEDVCNVRFWNDNDTDVPEAESLELSALDLRGRPVFRYRDICRGKSKYDEIFGGGTTNATAAFAIRRRLNRSCEIPIPVEWGGEYRYGPPYFCHTFDLYVPWAKFGKEHPEWFALWKGKRQGGRMTGQLCLSQPEVRRLLKEGVLRSVATGEAAAQKRGEPSPKLYDLSQNDDFSWCECPACTAAVGRYGQSGFYLTVVNEVADELAKTHPDVFLTTLAYHHTEDLPKGGVRPRDNVIVKLCDTRSNQAAPITEPCNREWLDRISSWGKVAKNLMIWDYAGCYVNPSVMFPFASEFAYGDTFRAYADNHAMGVFLEHQHMNHDIYELKFWMESHLMENPYQDATKLMVDFLKRYFGPAAKTVFRIRRQLDEIRRERGGYITYSPQPDKFDYLTLADLDKMAKLWDEAERLVAKDERRLKRVRRARGSQDKIRRFRQVAPKVKNGVFAFDAEKLDIRSPLSLVSDAESPSGKAIRIPLKMFGDKPYGPPLFWGIYDRRAKKNVSEGTLPPPKGSGYEWFELDDVRTPREVDNIFYFSKRWDPSFRICALGLNDMVCRMRVLARFAGDEIRIARIEFAPKATKEAVIGK